MKIYVCVWVGESMKCLRMLFVQIINYYYLHDIFSSRCFCFHPKDDYDDNGDNNYVENALYLLPVHSQFSLLCVIFNPFRIIHVNAL